MAFCYLFHITVRLDSENFEIGMVEEVIDGNTLILDGGERIQLIGIESPRSGEPGFAEATEFSRLAVEGKEVELWRGYSRTGYNRSFAVVWIDTDSRLMLNDELLLTGHAQATKDWYPAPTIRHLSSNITVCVSILLGGPQPTNGRIRRREAPCVTSPVVRRCLGR